MNYIQQNRNGRYHSGPESAPRFRPMAPEQIWADIREKSQLPGAVIWVDPDEILGQFDNLAVVSGAERWVWRFPPLKWPK